MFVIDTHTQKCEGDGINSMCHLNEFIIGSNGEREREKKLASIDFMKDVIHQTQIKSMICLPLRFHSLIQYGFSCRVLKEGAKKHSMRKYRK